MVTKKKKSSDLAKKPAKGGASGAQASGVKKKRLVKSK